MNDPRVEAAAAAMRDPKPNQIRYGEDLEEWVDRVMSDALAAADQSDREAGVHRVRVDDATVERVARVLCGFTGSCLCDEAYTERDLIDPQCIYHYVPNEEAARAVLAALTGAES